jgi:6-pyruvoyltetrahydropterin/6-carboxytetrahydropterin synthase
VLLPTQHRTIRVTEVEGEVEARFENRRWLFPREDCVLLPIENTTAELIARWIAGRLSDVIRQAPSAQIELLRVEVEENFGQWAVCELSLR